MKEPSACIAVASAVITHRCIGHRNGRFIPARLNRTMAGLLRSEVPGVISIGCASGVRTSLSGVSDNRGGCVSVVHRCCSRFRGPLRGTGVRVRNIGVGLGRRRASRIYRGYNEGVIIGINHFNGFLTYPKCPRYGGAGPLVLHAGTGYPRYNNSIVRGGAHGNTTFCNYSGCPGYGFVA